MPVTKSLESFYTHKFDNTPALPPLGAGDFNVFRLSESNGSSSPAAYARYDFFKIMLIRGKHRCHYADKSIALDGNTLLFFNPAVPYQFERLEGGATGFFCLFKEAFFAGSHIKAGRDLSVFAPKGKPVYRLNKKQDREVATLFEKILSENRSDYRFKYDLLRNYVSELIHYAMKMEPEELSYCHPDANARIAAIFTELLESQFPVQSPQQCITMRTASDFAARLSVHINHLNRAVRLTTGKTTSAHIAARLVSEATALLKHTNWNTSEIAYCLGFAQPAHFSSFFRRHTHTTPSSVRLV